MLPAPRLEFTTQTSTHNCFCVFKFSYSVAFKSLSRFLHYGKFVKSLNNQEPFSALYYTTPQLRSGTNSSLHLVECSEDISLYDTIAVVT